ncbi:MAG: hypothetical protein LBS91_05165 [Clostridiales Family XIII bacterium]|jgi:hypothetical protein|nr:hypothetical protein [Clostridiales Family XIII bacterium]
MEASFIIFLLPPFHTDFNNGGNETLKAQSGTYIGWRAYLNGLRAKL